MAKFEHSVQNPLNEEYDMEDLVSSFITAKGYDRNHGPIPLLDAATHNVCIFGCVKDELSLNMDDLKALPQHDVICALQCAGNRRNTMRTKLKEVTGVNWFDGAVMNCKWSGPLLKDVIEMAGINIGENEYEKAHVAFACFQTLCQDDEWYGASIPLLRALDPSSSVLVALNMNDKPLTPYHGAPVRIITPGIAGARSVKWLDRITVQMKESVNYYQQRDYKILPPEVDSVKEAEKWWPKVPAIQELPANSAIALPKSNAQIKRDQDGCIVVKGYALPCGSDGPIARVEVSVDGGESWSDAELLGAGEHEKDEQAELKWAWCLWKANVKIGVGKNQKILSRATDTAGNTQEKSPLWNFRGVAYNGYGEATGLEVI